jgi:hypothetical protein
MTVKIVPLSPTQIELRPDKKSTEALPKEKRNKGRDVTLVVGAHTRQSGAL